ncbi:hypothetical protein [Pseudomonas botevensis]|uniref:hypothetical protein n=1 Tax=Pseudomonas botevensis TaxID=2842352 RepID=UPI001C3D281D|nr:hypothetical protein [Pseudomonas botevensis]MBV4474739.1 hypothetical protein [Pseudomonas botevensis]
MSDNSLRLSTSQAWDAEIARNTEMFREADRLEEEAYRIIEAGLDEPDVWSRFSEAKAWADAKRTQAYRDWIRIKRAMMNKPDSR